VQVTNAGNVTVAHTVDVLLELSTSSDGSNPFQLANLNVHLDVKPGATQTFHLKVPIPAGAPGGNQYLVVVVDPGNVLGDVNLANNTAVSASPISLG